MLPARRHEISRLEAFSDAAFAFALTLLVVSLNVPRSYDELMTLVRGFPSFACCFALLFWIWHEHNMFFRRYGLQDAWTVFLNGLLLFVVLFYVYPLKFMFDSMFARFVKDPAVVPMSLACAGLLAVLVAVAAPLRFAPLSPMCFGLMGPAHWWFGTTMGRRRRALERRPTAPTGV
jgi:uncharacterized membrane protein